MKHTFGNGLLIFCAIILAFIAITVAIPVIKAAFACATMLQC